MSPRDPRPGSRPAGTPSWLLPTLLLLGVGTALPAAATTFTWSNPAGGSWSQASNWSPNGVPTASGDIAVLATLGGAYQVTLDVEPTLSEIHLESGPTLDLGSHSFGSVGQVFNAGTIVNFRGAYADSQIHNQALGTIQVAADDSIVVSQSITNDGTILVGPYLQNSLYLTESTVISGSGSLILEGAARVNCPLARPQTSIWLINSGGHTIDAAGDFWVPIQNEGLVRQDGSGGGLLTLHQFLFNYGTVRVSNGATINVDYPLVKSFGGRIVGTNGTFTVMMPYATGGSIDNLNGGSFVADGGDLLIGCGVVANGSIERTGGSGAVSIISVATPSYLVVQPDAELRVDGLMDVGVNNSTLENHGTVRVRGTLNIGGDTTNHIALTGDGTLVLEGGTIGTPAGALLTNSAGHTITGCGTITANIDNQGVIDINCTLGRIYVNGGTITNRNRIEVLRGSLVLNGGTLVNRGTLSGGGGAIKMQNGATLDNQSGVVVSGTENFYLGWKTPASTIVGGTLTAAGDGIFQNVGQANLRGVTVGPTATFSTIGGATTHAIVSSFVNQGTNDIQSGGSFVVDPSIDYLQTGGATVLHGGTLTVPHGFQVRGVLRGTGTVVGNVTNQGEVSSDISATGIRIQGDYNQLPTGRLTIGISGNADDQFGHLNVTGNATLDGTVAVSTSGGFTPSAGQDFQVMAYASRAGQFAQMQSDPGLLMAPLYGNANLTLEALSPVGVDDPNPLPSALRFYSRGMGFVLELPVAARVSVRAYDVLGREVGVLAEGPMAAGAYPLEIRGAGTNLPRGIYFARATIQWNARSEVRTARVALLR